MKRTKINTDSNFPTDLTPEELAAGFRLVYSKTDLRSDEVAVAACHVRPSVRIVKVTDVRLKESDSGIGYLLQVYGCERFLVEARVGKPGWVTKGLGTSSTLGNALVCAAKEQISTDFLVMEPPADVPVDQN